MTSLASVFVEGRIDTSGFGSDIKRGMSSSSVSSAVKTSGSSAGSHFKSGFGSALRGLAAPITAALGAAAVGSFFKGAIDEATDAAKVGARTANVLKTTGGVANISRGQIEKLSTAISNKSAIDDEAIQTGANLLLTFKNIRDESGKGNDIFKQATQTVTDLSVGMDQGLKASAVQVGKALNDPIKGITALSRVGVTFDAQQKRQITRFTESGRTMAAQKIILKELNSEFGGAAEAAATPAEKASVAWGNFKESVGTALLPVLGKLATWFTVTALPALTKFAGYVQDVIVPAISDFIGNVVDFFHRADESSGGFRDGIAKVKDDIVAFVNAAIPVVKSVIDYFVSMWPKIKPTLDSFVAGLKSAFEFAQTLVETWVKVISAIWDHFGSYIVSYLKATLEKVVQVLGGVFKVIGGLFDFFSDLLKGNWGDLWDDIKKILSGVWLIIEGIVKQAWNVVKTTLGIGLHVLAILWGKVWDGFKTKISGVWGGIKSTIATTWNAIKSGLQTAMDFVRNTFAGAFERARDHIGAIWSGLKALAAAPINFLITTIYDNGLRAMMNHIPGVDLPYAHPITFAKGGVMPGWSPGRDIHKFYSPTGGMLELAGGEGVLIPQATRALGGARGIAEINRRAASFASGGVWRPIGQGGQLSGNGLHDQYTGFPAIDFGTSGVIGLPVAAVSQGIVSRSEDIISGGQFASYGRVIQVMHQGFESLYAHLSGRLARLGQAVSGGMEIGLSGNTGNSTGPHLHFGVKGRSPYDFVNGSTDYGTFKGGDVVGGIIGGIGSAVGSVIPDWLSSIPGKIDGLLHDVSGMGSQFGAWGSIMANAGKSALNSAKDFVLDKIKDAAAGLLGLGTFDPTKTGGLAGSAESLAKKMLPTFGFAADQFAPLDSLWTKESGWNVHAVNPAGGDPSTSAYGIPQALPGSKMASAGPMWLDDAWTQMKWGLGYIKGRYGNPSGAWAHSQQYNWYDKGGKWSTGTVGINTSGHDEYVATTKADMSEVVRAIQRVEKALGKQLKIDPGPLDSRTVSISGAVTDRQLAAMQRWGAV